MTDERQWLRTVPGVPDRHGDELHHHQPDGSVRVERVASECDLYGHPYEIMEREDVRPERVPEWVHCNRCGMSWKVER